MCVGRGVLVATEKDESAARGGGGAVNKEDRNVCGGLKESVGLCLGCADAGDTGGGVEDEVVDGARARGEADAEEWG